MSLKGADILIHLDIMDVIRHSCFRMPVCLVEKLISSKYLLKPHYCLFYTKKNCLMVLNFNNKHNVLIKQLAGKKNNNEILFPISQNMLYMVT